jgi:hypothetical protein
MQPLPFSALRDDPKEELTAKPAAETIVLALEGLLFLGLPVTHVERIGHDPRAGFQFLKQLWPETLVDRLQEK